VTGKSERVSLSDSTPFCLCWKSRKTSTAGRNGDINVTQHGLLNKRVSNSSRRDQHLQDSAVCP
ncbi:hypothetical protein AMELA_G00174560, partial [Ameiurus melas]